jgi:hypothetical protein
MKSLVPAVLVIVALLFSPASLRADGGVKPADDGTLVDFSKSGSSSQITAQNGATFKLDSDNSAVKLTTTAGKGYPGVTFVDPSGLWDLSAYKGVVVELTNNGANNVKMSLRVDSGDDWKQEPWDCEIIDLAPGQTSQLLVTFGRSYKQADATPKVQPDHILKVLVFAIDPDAAGDVTIKSLKADK